MAFVNFPPPVGTDVQREAWLLQMVYAFDEVAAAMSNDVHPPHTNLWDANEISTGLTTTTITDTNKNWAVYRSDLGSWVKRWTGWTAPGPTTTEPTTFDIVLFNLWDHPHDYRNMLRFEIVDQNWVDNGDGTFTSNELTFGGAIDTGAPWFPGMGYYTHYVIIRRGVGGVFVPDRVPEWTNDLTLEWASAISTTTTSITVGDRSWGTNQWAGKWVYFAVSGNIRTAQVTSNDRDMSGNCVLHLSAGAGTPDVGTIGILSSGGKYWTPGHQPQAPENEVASTASWPWRIWYRGTEAVDTYYTQRPDGTLSTKQFPAADLTFRNLFNPLEEQHWDMVGGTSPSGADRDLFSTPINSFDSPPDWCFVPHFHKTLRSWQATAINDCQQFIPYRSDSYDGWAERFINPMTISRMFWEAGVNAAHGTTGSLVLDGGGTVIGINVSVSIVGNYFTDRLPAPVKVTIEQLVSWTNTAPFGSPPVWVSTPVKNPGGQMVDDQECTYDGTMITGTFTQDFVDQEIWFCFGPTRLRPSRFRYWYDKECFIPAAGDAIDGGEPPPVDPPTDTNPGNWVSRPKSTQLLDFESHGIAMSPLNGNEYGGETPNEGELARYVGDSWDFPTTGLPTTSTPTWEVTYENNFYEGKSLAEAGSRNWDIAASGSVTVVDDALQFGGAGLHLWAAGIMIGDAGETSHTMDLSTASFTSTTITDSSHSASHLWDNTGTGRWEGHWIIVWQPGDIGSGGTAGPLHKAKRPITAYDHTTQTITFPALAGLTSTYSYLDSSNGTHTGTTTVRIREPKYEKNKLKGGICELARHLAGDVLTGTIVYSEDDRIRVDGWKDAGGSTVSYTPLVGDGFTVKRVSTGTIWKWSSGAWTKPTGTDSRGGIPFPDEQWTIPPNHRPLYGRCVSNGDLIGDTFETETKKMRGTLKMTKAGGVTFSPDADPTTMIADNNAEFTHNDGETGCNPAFNDVSLSSGATANPFAKSSGHPCTFDASRSCGWPQVSLNPGITASFVPTSLQRLRLAPSGTFLNYATFNAADDDQDLVGVITPGEDLRVFDANGDPVTFRKWTAFDTSSSSTDLQRTGSAIFGSVTRPNEAPADTGSSHSTNEQGYYVQEAVLILDWSGVMNYL